MSHNLATLLPWTAEVPETVEPPARIVPDAERDALRSAVTLAARGVLTDPTDAPIYLDLDGIDSSPEGIMEALATLAREKPYLAYTPLAPDPRVAQMLPWTVEPPPGPTGIDQGSRGTLASWIADAPMSGDEWLKASGMAAVDHRRAGQSSYF